MSGIIIDIPDIKIGLVRFLVKPGYIEGYNQRLPNKIRLPVAGQGWQFSAKLRRPSGNPNPIGFWLMVKGIDPFWAFHKRMKLWC